MKKRVNEEIFTWATGKTSGREMLIAQVDNGWKKLVNDLIEDLIKLGWDKEIHQIKEKFGGLRFYIGYGSTPVFDRIDKATSESLKTCMHCGEPGRLRGPGWYVTLCDKHAEEFGYKEVEK